MTITDELAVDSAKYHVVDIKASGLSKVDKIRNEKLKAIMVTMEKELKDSLMFYRHYSVDHTEKSLSYAFEVANQKILKEDKKTNAITALRDFRRAVVRDKHFNVSGVRFEDTKLPWKVVTPGPGVVWRVAPSSVLSMADPKAALKSRRPCGAFFIGPALVCLETCDPEMTTKETGPKELFKAGAGLYFS